MSPLQAITRNLPNFVRDPLISMLGHECYTSLIWDINLSDKDCLRLGISKVLGLGIVFGSSMLKVPQIGKILSSRSARGVSLASYLLDTASLIITVAYNLRLNFPFSTYGENVFLLIQNIIITALILTFSNRRRAAVSSFLAASLGVTFILCQPIVPVPLLRFLMALAIPLALSSKVPQIITNHKAQSTGQLSAILVFVSLAGCVARLFTTQTETGDAVLWWSFALTALLNGVLAIQMAIYWKASSIASHSPSIHLTDRSSTKSSPAPPQRSSQPSPQPSSSGRYSPKNQLPQRYTRKVD